MPHPTKHTFPDIYENFVTNRPKHPLRTNPNRRRLNSRAVCDAATAAQHTHLAACRTQRSNYRKTRKTDGLNESLKS
jgi:hypothetical protein